MKTLRCGQCWTLIFSWGCRGCKAGGGDAVWVKKKGVGGWSAGHRQWFWMHLIHRAIMWCNSTLLVESRVYTIPQETAQCSVLSGNYALFHKELHQVHHPPNLRQGADSAVQFWSDGPPIQLIFMICTSSHLLIGKTRFLRRTLYIGHCRLGVGWGVKSQFGQCPNVGCFIENGASLAYPSHKINPSFGCSSACHVVYSI